MEPKAPDPSQANISYGNTLQNTRHPNSNEPRDVINTTPEDLAILNECSSEALWSKSVPLMATMGGSVLFLGKTGKIPATGKHAVFAAFAGFVIGKISHMKQCEDKFLQKAPHSQYSTLIRKKRGLPEPEFDISSDAVSHDPIGMNNYQNSVDSTSVNNYGAVSNPSTDENNVMSYEKLRGQKRVNDRRMEMEQSQKYVPLSIEGAEQSQKYPPPGVENWGSETTQPRYNPEPPQRIPRKAPTNKYGDEGFE